MFRVLTRLKSRLYRQGETVLEQNQVVRELLLVGRGHVDLYGFFKDEQKQERRALLVTLPEKSWFGDYQILLDLSSTFQLVAGAKSRKKVHKNDGFQDLI
jgi:signal-transduction protein with cAMP-binding, CBS, and nucleotidyltransferase domain